MVDVISPTLVTKSQVDPAFGYSPEVRAPSEHRLRTKPGQLLSSGSAVSHWVKGFYIIITSEKCPPVTAVAGRVASTWHAQSIGSCA